MHVTIKTISVGKGDCIAFQLSNNQEHYNILIDCGDFNDKVRKLVCEDFGKHIDLMVATHIDDDHIAGLGAMLEDADMRDLVIEKIWFNCYQNVGRSDVKLSDDQRVTIQNLESKLHKSIHKEKEDIAEKDAALLSRNILKNNDWVAGWNSEPILSGERLPICEGRLGELKVFCPTTTDQARIKKKYEELFLSEMMEDTFVPFDDSAYIYEILNRLQAYDQYREPNVTDSAYAPITRDVVEEYAKSKQKYDTSDENRSSISFVWEYNGHKILFAGDTSHSNILKGLKALYPDAGSLIFDAVKVPHHGSEHNISNKLLNFIDSPHFIITGAEEDYRPSPQTLSRIIVRELPQDEDATPVFSLREIHCNTLAEQLKPFLNSDNAVKEDLHFNIDLNEVNLCYDAEI